MERIISDPNEKQWGMLPHLTALATLIVYLWEPWLQKMNNIIVIIVLLYC